MLILELIGIAKNNNAVYLDSFGVEHIQKEIQKFIENSHVIYNIFKIQTYDYVMGDTFVLDFLILC